MFLIRKCALVVAFAAACDSSSNSSGALVRPNDAGAAIDSSDASCSGKSRAETGDVTRLVVEGDPAEPSGVFDPSIVYPKDATAGFLAYSTVSGRLVHTRIAASNDHGATFHYFSDVNNVTPATVATTESRVCGAATCDGRWVHETPSVVVDPNDPDPEQLFKVFAHTYFVDASDGLHYDIGRLTMFTSKAPEGPWKEHRIIGWNSSSPDALTGVSQNASSDPALSGLAGCFFMTEPGAIIAPLRDGVEAIHLAIGCVRLISETDIPIEVKLVRSVDHGRSWKFVSTLLDSNDAKALGAPKSQLNAASFYRSGGKLFLFVSPDGIVNLGGTEISGYRGCLGFEVSDLEAGAVTRCGGKAVQTFALLGQPRQFVGACAYDEGASSLGVAVGILDVSAPPPFKIHSTGRAP